MKIKFRVLDEFKTVLRDDGTLVDLTPTKGTADAVGFDIRAAAPVVIPAIIHRKVVCEQCGTVVEVHVPGRAVVRSGICLEIPLGFEGQVRPRSGLARKNGISIINTPGTIDPDFRGEMSCTMINFDGQPFEVKVGDRIAQLIIAETVPVTMERCEELNTTARGEGGFGSTGVR